MKKILIGKGKKLMIMHQYISKLVIIFIVLFNSLLYPINHSKLFVTSVPKSGTHLLSTCLSKLLNARQVYSKNNKVLDENLITKLNPRNFYIVHARFQKHYLQMMENNNLKGILMQRDPRDVIISSMFWIKKDVNNDWPHLKKLNTNELISKLINEFKTAFLKLGSKNGSNIAAAYKLFLPWSNKANMCVISFENLIGSNGGGDDTVQVEEIKKITRFLGLNLSEHKINDVAKNLFGHSGTFRRGLIGSWKEYFNEQHKEQFKKLAGSLLIKLGYEKNLNW